MRRFLFSILISSILSLLPFPQLRAQTSADPELLAAINQIKAIDNHAHPKRALKEGETDAATDFADPFDPAFDMPVRLRPDNPEFIVAQRFLYLTTQPQGGTVSADQLATGKKKIRDEKQEQFPARRFCLPRRSLGEGG